MQQILFLVLGALCAVQSAPVQVFDCSRGCPLEVAVVCGGDGHTYQSECLAICQGVKVVYKGPCEEFPGAHGSPQQRRTQLHKLLQSAQHHVIRGRSTLEGLPDNDQRLHTRTDMHRFSKEGFRLVGWVPLQDKAFTNHQTVHTGSFTGPTDPGSDVRALRVTNTGLLYAAHYDLEALAQTLRKPNLNAKAAGTVTSNALNNNHRQLRECGALPDLPHFNPDEVDLLRRSQHRARLGSSRRLLLDTVSQAKHEEHELSSLEEDSDEEVSHSDVPVDVVAAGNGVEPTSSPPAGNMTEPVTGITTAVPDGMIATNATGGGNTTDVMFTPAAGSVDDLTDPLDGRAVCTPLKFPFKAIGQLELRDSNRMSVCTGSMVGDDAVLTAGHCVFQRDQDGGSFYRSLSFAPGRYRSGSGYKDPYGVIPWAFATVFDTFQTVPDLYQYDWDVAVIRLTQAIGKSVTGYLGLAQGCAFNPKTKRPMSIYSVQTAGYATDDPMGTCSTMSCSLMRDDCKSRSAYHNCTSKNGLSGSPFFLPKTYRVRAVLVGTVTTDDSELRVAHIVGTGTYAAVTKWITESRDSAMSDDSKSNDTTVRGKAPAPGKTPVVSSQKGSSGILNSGAAFIDGTVRGTLDVLFGGGTDSRDSKKPAAKPSPKPAPKSPPKKSDDRGLLGSVLGSARDAAESLVNGKTPARSPPPKKRVKRVPPSPRTKG